MKGFLRLSCPQNLTLTPYTGPLYTASNAAPTDPGVEGQLHFVTTRSVTSVHLDWKMSTIRTTAGHVYILASDSQLEIALNEDLHIRLGTTYQATSNGTAPASLAVIPAYVFHNSTWVQISGGTS